MTLADWIPLWWSTCVAHRTAGTRINYELAGRKFILPMLGHVTLAELDTPVVAAWVDDLRSDGASPDQIRRAMGVLSTCLRQATQRGLITTGNPVLAVDRPCLPTRPLALALSAEQIECLRYSIMSHLYGSLNETRALRSATIVSLMAYGGMRPGEVVGAKVTDVDFASRGFWVRDVFSIEHRVGDTKTHSLRFAPLPDAALEDLRVWLNVRGGSGRDWLFPGRDGTVSASTHENWCRSFRVTRARLARTVPEWADDYQHLRPYDLRHSCASMRIRAGDPLPEIASDLGHSTEMLLRRYTHHIRALRRQPSASFDAQIAAGRARFDTPALANGLRDRALAPAATPYQRRKLSKAHDAVTGEPYVKHIDGKIVWFNEKPDRRRRKWRTPTS